MVFEGRKLSVLGLLFAAGCGGSGGALYSGQSQDPRVAATQLAERESVPGGYRVLGVVEARCDRQEPAFGELIEHEPACRNLAELMCSTELLSRALRERAAEVGGTVLVGRRCSSEAGEGEIAIRCGAEVAAPKDDQRTIAAGPAVTDEVVPLRDVREARDIQLMFTPLVTAPRASRSAHLVAERAVMPVQNVVLGDLLARCGDDCTDGALRESLRVAAGRVGASDVVGVRCLNEGDERVCGAQATAPIVDPRRVAAAR
jgi:hypothetical protein